MKKKNKLIFLYVLIPFAIIAFIFVLKVHKTINIENTTKNFINEIKEKNFKNAYKMTSTEFQKKINKQDFEKQIKQSGLINAKKINLDKKNEEENNAKMIINIKDEIKKSIQIIFVKDFGKWKIHNIKLENSSPKTPKKEETKNIGTASVPTF